MKKILLLPIIAFLSIFNCIAQVKTDVTVKDVHKVVENFFQAFSDHDTALLKANCNSDILVLESGLVWNMDTLMSKLKRSFPADFKRVNSFEFIDTEINGNTAWTTYYNQADITANGKQRKVRWLETSLFIKENGQWKMKLLHSTTLERQD